MKPKQLKHSFVHILLPLLAISILSSALGACRTVDFYELERLSDPVMNMAEGEAHTHFNRKVFYSMEGAAGGMGAGAGGGCGCY